MASHKGLFSPSLISAEAAAAFPAGFTIRPLEKEDYARGYLDCLRVLTWVGNLEKAEYNERYDEMAAAQGTYYLLVIEHEGRIVGSGSLIVEKKFIHNRGVVGHVEEVSIAKELQGRGFGKKMLQALDSVGKSVGCYKNILNCSEKNEPFYVMCGYSSSGNEMAHYFEEEKEPYYRG